MYCSKEPPKKLRFFQQYILKYLAPQKAPFFPTVYTEVPSPQKRSIFSNSIFQFKFYRAWSRSLRSLDHNKTFLGDFQTNITVKKATTAAFFGDLIKKGRMAIRQSSKRPLL